MTSALICDIVLGLILVISTIIGAKKGFISGIIAIVVVIASIAGAFFVSKNLTEPVANSLYESYGEKFLSKTKATVLKLTDLDEDILEKIDVEGKDETGIKDALTEKTNLSEEKIDKYFGKYLTEISGTVNNLKDAVNNAISKLAFNIFSGIVHILLFILSFFVLRIVLGLLSKLVDLALEKNFIHTTDTILGGAFGFLQAALVIFVVFWICQKFNLFNYFSGISESKIVSILMRIWRNWQTR